MRKWKALASLAVTAALCVSVVGTAAFAENGAKLTLASPAALPAVGQTFTVTVSIANNPGLGAAQFTVKSDSAVVQCVSADIGKVLNGALAASNPAASTGAIIAAASSEAMKSNGELGVLTYKVLASGDPKLSLSDIVLSSPEGKDISYTVETAALAADAKPETGVTGDGTGGTAVPASTPTPTPSTVSPSPSATPSASPSASPSATPTPTPTPTAELQTAFSDVPSGYWASAYIQKAVQAGLFQGLPDGSFRPDMNVTRAQFITVLWRSAGKPAAKAAAFSDVPTGGDLYYTGAVAWGAEKGYITGVANGDGTFAFLPDGQITREQAMAILFRYSGSQSGTEALLTGVYDKQFTDSGRISAYAKGAVYWAVYNTYISGTSDTTLSPAAPATRAQLAKILVNYLANTKA